MLMEDTVNAILDSFLEDPIIENILTSPEKKSPRHVHVPSHHSLPFPASSPSSLASSTSSLASSTSSLGSGGPLSDPSSGFPSPSLGPLSASSPPFYYKHYPAPPSSLEHLSPFLKYPPLSPTSRSKGHLGIREVMSPKRRERRRREGGRSTGRAREGGEARGEGERMGGGWREGRKTEGRDRAAPTLPQDESDIDKFLAILHG
jgi:hypothetical protein